MPYKPQAGCRHPGCRERAVAYGYCKQHQPDAGLDTYERSRARTEAKHRYNSDWKKLRDIYFHAHPLCERCLAEGRYVPAKEVHHIKPLNQGGQHTMDNLMSLCQSCHNKIHIEELGDRVAGGRVLRREGGGGGQISTTNRRETAAGSRVQLLGNQEGIQANQEIK